MIERRGVDHSRSMPNWLARRAEGSPGGLAMVVGEERWTFSALNRRVERVARQLAFLGVHAGDRVAVLQRNGLGFVELVHAVSRLGAVLVPLNIRLTAIELEWQLGDTEARLLVVDEAHEALGRRAALAGGARVIRAEVLDATEEAPVPLRSLLDRSAVHCIIYTSGTTGRSKGAMLTYGNHWWSAVGSALNLGNHADDRWLAVLPLFHVGGLAILMRSVIYGIPAIVHESFDPAAVNRAIDEDGVTIISVVSTMLQRMLDQRGDRPYPANLRTILLGGGPAPRPLLEACAECGAPVVQSYGLTETASQVVTLAPLDALRKLGSAGLPLLPNELRIERDGEDAGPDAVGEIVVRGPTVTIGYINRPEETARAIREGWLYTGDLGYLDHEGYLYVVDRRNDLIISGGENIYPAEVEAVLLAHAGIDDAGVVGVPDERWGQVPVAAVVLHRGVKLTEAEIIAFAADRLARYKVPTRIHFVEQLPRNAAGKLQRHALRTVALGR